MVDIKTMRRMKFLTQKEAAELLGMNLRTYQNYEMGVSTKDKFKIESILRQLDAYHPYDEETGVYELEEISKLVKEVLDKFKVEYAILFGSYAKNKATPKSDIDIVVSDNVDGFNFLGLETDLQEVLNKKVDLLRIDDASKNIPLLNEILKYGIRIYKK